MERVDYHLERLLPSVQLLSSVKLFTSEELRSFMHKRRVAETSLISRNVSKATYLDYVRLEESFERLTQLKLSRSPRDGKSEDAITLKDRSKIRRFQEKHIISIWQRFITKLGRHDVEPFTRYLHWLKTRGMRRVYSEVAAQALSLHSSHTPLWIQVADWELNSNMDASAARLTLLRGIRLNTAIHSDAKRSAIVAKREGRRRKRQRRLLEGEEDKDEDDELSDEMVQDAESESAPKGTLTGTSLHPLVLPEALPLAQLQLVDLWLAYFRMEIVFLERLRRRWAVLGLSGSRTVKEVNDKGREAEVDASSDQEDAESASPAQSISKPAMASYGKATSEDEIDRKTSTAIDNSAPTQILSGALPLRIISSALDLPISTQTPGQSISSPSLSPLTRYIFLFEALKIVAEFPFANAREEEEEAAQGLRMQLVDSIREVVVPMSRTSSSLLTLLSFQASLSLLCTSIQNNVTSKSHTMDPEEATKAQRKKLEVASQLVRREGSAATAMRQCVLDFDVFGSGWETFFAAEKSHRTTGRINGQPHLLIGRTRSENHVIRQISRSIRRYLSELAQETEDGDEEEQDWIIRCQVQFANLVKQTVKDLEGVEKDPLPLIKVLFATWRQLSFRESEDDSETSDHQSAEREGIESSLTAVEDPLAPYLSAVLLKTLEAVPASSGAISALRELFAQQLALHGRMHKQ